MSAGFLYMVATPIGNLGDISARALEVLAAVEVIFAEDTRHSRKLLTHYNITTSIKNLNSNNERQRSEEILRQLGEGKSVAYISDAGTPGVSDPGAYLVAQAHRAGHKVQPIAGPSALAAALSVCGFSESSSNTLFVGFLPVKGAKRREAIEQIVAHQGIVVIYEGPHRVGKTLKDIEGQMPSAERQLCICRELSKVHEEIIPTTVRQALEEHLEAPKGEYTLVLGPKKESQKAREISDLEDKSRILLEAGLSRRDTAKALSVLFGVSKKDLYRALDSES